MATIYEIQAKALAQHTLLGSHEDAVNKQLFDQQHAQVWAECDTEMKERKLELEAQSTLTPDEQGELAILEVGFPTPMPPSNPFNPEPPTFEPPTVEGIAHRVEYIETFLHAIYP